MAKAIKRKENLATYRAVKRARYFARVQTRRAAKDKAAKEKAAKKVAKKPKKATKAKK